ETHRRASRHSTSLSENSLNIAHCEKSSASILGISKRQALETLSRDKKAASRTLTQLKAKDKELQRNQEKLRGDEVTQKDSKSELEEKLATLQGDHACSKQEYEN
ncbi:hypothetical protein BDR04DRAFT_1040229, partial [Suillus decipiens]